MSRNSYPTVNEISHRMNADFDGGGNNIYHGNIVVANVYQNVTNPFQEEIKTDLALAEFAKIQYRSKMEIVTATPKFVEENVLEEKHQEAVNSTIGAISIIEELTFEQKHTFKKELDKTFKLLKKLNLKKLNCNAPAIGIDLGTTFCCMAVFRNQILPEIIPNDLGNHKTPSYISFLNGSGFDDEDEEEEKESNEPIFGETAKMNAHDNPLFTIFDVKRMLGRKFSHPLMKNDMQLWPFNIFNDGEKIKVKTGPNSMHTPLELTALLLKHLNQMASKFVNEEVVSAVVTVPAYFNDQQRELTKEACNFAGLNVLQLINEPTAAAVAYNIHRKHENQSEYKCLIFDFGGGTLDLALLTMQMTKIIVLAVGGDLHLGGEDINNNMVKYCIQQFEKKHGVNLKLGKQSTDDDVVFKTIKRLRRLKSECETQKRLLSQKKSVTILLEAIHGSTDLVVRMTRDIFNEINKSIFERCLQKTEKVLKDANLEPSLVDDVVLVGGSSRIPKVQELLTDYFGGKCLLQSVELDQAVAAGAAMLAFQTKNVEIPNVLIRESHSEEIEMNTWENKLKPPMIKLNDETRIENVKKISNSFQWKLLPCKGLKMWGHAAVAVNGVIYSFSGRGDNYSENNPIDIHILNTFESPLKWKLLSENANASDLLSLESNAFIPTQRIRHTVVASGQLIYLWGGYECNNKLHIFNTETLRWEQCEVKGEIPANRRYHTATVVKNKMYVFGGKETGKCSLDSIVCLELSTLSWSPITPKNNPPTSRDCHSATVHGDRFILIFGGKEDGFKRCRSVGCFDVETNEWTFPKVTGKIPEPRFNHCAFSHKGFTYIFGGWNGSKSLDDLFRFDFEKLEWEKVTPSGPCPDPRFLSQSVVINDQVFIFGGAKNKSKIYDNAFVLTIA